MIRIIALALVIYVIYQGCCWLDELIDCMTYAKLKKLEGLINLEEEIDGQL